jgi:hypothetical protein
MTDRELMQMAREAGIVVTGEAVWRLCELVAAAEREAAIEDARTVGGEAGAEMEKLIRARREQ